MSRRTILTCVLALVALTGLAGASAAAAAKRKAPTPKITKVSPMRVTVGGTLTIRGRHFKPRAKRNTVVFRGAQGRSAFVKPRRASRRKLVVKVTGAVSRLLRVHNNVQRPTRLKLRVLAGRFSKFTSRRLSPVVVGGRAGEDGGGGNAGPVCQNDSDHDNDLLPNDLEKQIKTDPCLADTDGDGMSDGWEVYSARDIKPNAMPDPTSDVSTRSYTNALDSGDGAYDFDGDGLLAIEEYRAWRRAGSSFDASRIGHPGLDSPLGYSDGTKFSRHGETPSVPAWRGAAYGLPTPTQSFPSTYNLHGDGLWRDDERDADADGLSNWLESSRGPSRNSWWQSYWAEFSPPVLPWKEGVYFGYFDERPFATLDLANSDVDGDGLLDGEDDQDNDDFNNITELYEVLYDLDGNGNPPDGDGRALPSIDIAGTDYVINAMNPCAPNVDSLTCNDYVPF